MAEPLDSIHVHTRDDAVRARRAITQAILGRRVLPRELPAEFVNHPSPISGLPDCVRLTISDCQDAYRWVPGNFNGKFVVVHQGHENPPALQGFELCGVADVCRDLYGAGCAVVACRMPPNPHDGTIPLKNFLRPVFTAITNAFATLPIRDVAMTGISGGGWATLLCAALDWRIRRSVSVAGWMPLYLDVGLTAEQGGRDWEQTLPGLSPYRYLDLAILAATFRRRHRQIVHAGDSVYGNNYLATGPDYLTAVQERSQAAGGEFVRTIIPQSQHAYLAAGRSIVSQEFLAA